MKYFIVEGTILDAEKMTDEIMKIHQAYTQKAMDEGMVFISGLKSDMSGGIFILKAEDERVIANYLEHEPFKLHGIQEYRVIEFNYHFVNSAQNNWFEA